MSASKLVSVKNLLEKSGSPLAKISGKAALLEELTIFIRKALPDPLKNHLIAASEHDSTLVLTADSAAWAARMRFHETEILTHHNRKQGPVSHKVVIRVRNFTA